MKTLLVIDMQKGFIKNKRYEKLCSRLNRYLENSMYDNIIFTKYKNDKNKNVLYQEKIGWYGLTSKEEQEFAVNVPNNTVIIGKYTYGFSKKDLDYIKSLNVKSIDVCGIKASACVYAISLQLWDMGIYPNILINYVEGDKETRKVMKKVFVKQFGGVDERK